MMDTLITFVQKWGYLAVFLGALVEGESVILTASGMASQGYLDLKYTMLFAFLGTTIADQLLYMLGYKYGDAIFRKFPKLQKPANRAFGLLHKYDVWFIIVCRFIYGIRVASAIVIGAAKIKPCRFIPLNILSAIIWAVISCTLGYYLGQFMVKIMEKADDIQKTIFLYVGGIAIFSWAIIKVIKAKKNKSKIQDELPTE